MERSKVLLSVRLVLLELFHRLPDLPSASHVRQASLAARLRSQRVLCVRLAKLVTLLVQHLVRIASQAATHMAQLLCSATLAMLVVLQRVLVRQLVLPAVLDISITILKALTALHAVLAFILLPPLHLFALLAPKELILKHRANNLVEIV